MSLEELGDGLVGGEVLPRGLVVQRCARKVRGLLVMRGGLTAFSLFLQLLERLEKLVLLNRISEPLLVENMMICDV